MVFVGLGNPGEAYRLTRHNIGFCVIDHMARITSVKLKKQLFRPVIAGKGIFQAHEFFLVKPLTFMNKSGDIASWILAKTACSVKDIVIVSDHLDLPAGTLRLRASGSSGGQKGLQSFIDTLGTRELPRLFIGIGRPGQGVSVHEHVLGIPENPDLVLLDDACRTAANALLRLLTEPVGKVMSDVNRKQPV